MAKHIKIKPKHISRYKTADQLMNELNISTEDMSHMADGKTVFLSNLAVEALVKLGALYKLNGVDRVNVSLFLGEHDEHKVIVTEGEDEKV